MEVQITEKDLREYTYARQIIDTLVYAMNTKRYETVYCLLDTITTALASEELTLTEWQDKVYNRILVAMSKRTLEEYDKSKRTTV